MRQIDHRWWLLLWVVVWAGCDDRPEVIPVKEDPGYQLFLPMKDSPYDVLTQDFDGNGLPDISVISHGESYGQTFFQVKPREFVVGPRQEVVGFHPGNLLAWSGTDVHMVLSAEGVGQIVGLQSNARGEWRSVSSLSETLPGRSVLFEWPGWGKSLATIPFKNGYITLIKGYDPVKGQADAQIRVNLSEDPDHTVRRAEKVTVADIDGDGISELLMASPITRQVFVVRRPEKKAEAPRAEVLLEDSSWGTPNQVLCWDVNHDGQPDLLIPEQTGLGRILVYLNQGAGRFVAGAPIKFLTDKGVRQLTAARDQDGRDFLLVSGFGMVGLYDLSADPTLSAEGDLVYPHHAVKSRIPEVTPTLALTDIDGDGWLDAVVGRTAAAPESGNVWLGFGPLWEHFADMEQQSFDLK